MAEGFVKLYRCIIESDIYQMSPLYLRVFERLILEANHKDKTIPYKNKGSNTLTTKLIKRGERLTSLRQIAEWVSWYERGQLKTPNVKTIKTILDWLATQKMISIYTNEGNRKETHYIVLNYDTYQSKESNESNAQVTPGKQSADTNKNVKNEKNEKKDISLFDEEEILPKKPSEKKGIYSSEFLKWYSEYPRPEAKADSFKSFEKVRKDKGLDYIWLCTRNYIDYRNSFPEDKKPMAYQSNNFFGQKQYCQDYETAKQPPKEPRTPAQQALDKMM